MRGGGSDLTAVDSYLDRISKYPTFDISQNILSTYEVIKLIQASVVGKILNRHCEEDTQYKTWQSCDHYFSHPELASESINTNLINIDRLRNRKPKLAFTLAEVLITLGIIGVIAALTLPAVINNTQGKEVKESIKKAYSTLSQAILLYQKDTGEEVNSLTFDKTDSMKKAILPYFSGAVDCGKGTEETACMFSGNVRYKTYNGKQNVGVGYFNDGQYIVSDGMMYFFENMVNGVGVFISVDVNGFNKKPNQWGRDLFTFELTKNGQLLPMGAEGTCYNENTYCSMSLSSSLNGIACTNKALYDESFWKVKRN